MYLILINLFCFFVREGSVVVRRVDAKKWNYRVMKSKKVK